MDKVFAGDRAARRNDVAFASPTVESPLGMACSASYPLRMRYVLWTRSVWVSGSKCEQRARALSGALHTVLRERGFRKRGAWLRRHRSGAPLGLVQVLGIQLSGRNQGDSCLATINVGAGLSGLPALPLDTERVRPRDCLWSERIGSTWALGDDPRELVDEVAEAAGAWFDDHDSVEALLEPLQARDPSTMGAWLGQVDGLAAARMALGNEDGARDLLERKKTHLESAHRDASGVDDFMRRLGLIADPAAWDG